jgi:hypothetical protein
MQHGFSQSRRKFTRAGVHGGHQDKLAGKVSEPEARLMVMMRPSSGWRKIAKFLEPSSTTSSSNEFQNSYMPGI